MTNQVFRNFVTVSSPRPSSQDYLSSWALGTIMETRLLTSNQQQISNMASKVRSVVHKLHAVTLIKSPIGQPWWEKRTVKFLRLNKLHKTVILKNTATMNGQLQAIKHLIDIKPIEVVDEETSSTGEEGVFLRENGQFHLNKFEKHLEENPRLEKVIRARRKQVVWERRRR